MSDCTQKERYVYEGVRDHFGEARGSQDLLDFPMVQSTEIPEYTAYMDIMEERLSGKKVFILSEYEGFMASDGGDLADSRCEWFRRTSGLEDFINPLEEPSKNLTYKLQPTRAFVYQNGDELCMIRLSHDPEAGDVAVKDTIYDVTDVPPEDLRRFNTMPSRTYLKKDRVREAKEFLKKNGCGLGEAVGGEFRRRLASMLILEHLRDTSSFKKSSEALDFVLVKAGSPQDRAEELKSSISKCLPVKIGIFEETAFRHRYRKNGVITYVDMGCETKLSSVVRVGKSGLFTAKESKYDIGMKHGDLVFRTVEEGTKKEFEDGSSVTGEKITTSRIISLTAADEKGFADLTRSVLLKEPSRRMGRIRELSDVTNKEDWTESVRISRALVRLDRAANKSAEDALHSLFPLGDHPLGVEVLETYARDKKVLLEEELVKAVRRPEMACKADDRKVRAIHRLPEKEKAVGDLER